jgi:DHA2 family methylenomycin A resistance protein-like MFS transporter
MFAGLLLWAGGLGDRLGARRVFQAGLTVFTAASAACGLAPTVGVLISTRLVQGLGAALLVPASLALLQAAYTDRASRARAVGVWGGIAGLAAAAGPTVGGLLAFAVSWRAVFLLNVPFGLMALALTAYCVPAPPSRGEHGLDSLAQGAGVIALGALTLALIEVGERGWTNSLVLAALAVFPLAFAAFLLLERRAEGPMLPLGLFVRPTFSGATLIGLLINLGFYGQLFVVGLYFQQVRGYSPLTAALALLPETVVVPIASALSGRLTGRVGPRPTILIGLSLGGVGLLGLLVAGAHTSYALLVAPLVAAGFGMAFTMPAVTTAVVEAAPARQAGVASGVINASRQVGGLIGVALLGALVNDRVAFLPGLHAAALIAGAAFLAGAFVGFAFVRPDLSGD